jgi:aminoglycoside phosphotransferase (APT) family kinase protein
VQPVPLLLVGEQEIPLIGDGATQGIVRVGDTVRRPVRPFTTAIQDFLAHLHERGFTAAPVPMGVDEQGREVLSFVSGDVPREPLPSWTADDEVLVALARLIRQLHEAAAGWVPPAGVSWGTAPGLPAVRVSDDAELVSHRDYCPGNVVFRDGRPAALIDFDLAKPTTRVADIGNALYWWVPLCDPLDRAEGFASLDAAHRVAVFADAYGMTAAQRVALVPDLTEMIKGFHASARRGASVDPVARRWWEDGLKDKMPRAEAWILREGPAIASQISA